MNTQPTLIAIAVVEYCGRFLIGQRADGVPLAGLWEFPGGKVKPDESPIDAAARECLEETGLAVDIGAPYSEVVHQYDHDHLRLHFFASTPCDPHETPKPPFRWVEATDLTEYDFPAANAALVARLVASGAGN